MRKRWSQAVFPVLVLVIPLAMILTGCSGVASAPSPGQLSITISQLPNGQVQISYQVTLTASGGVVPYTWSITAGQLPPGLTLGATTGQISGTPTQSGSFSFTVTVRDSSTPTPQGSAKTLSINTTSATGPNISSISPTSGPSSGGTSVTITGTNFVSGATVLFGGTAATGVTVTSATQIRATTPAHAAGAVDVQVRNPSGQIATLTGGFTFIAGLQITTASLPNGTVGASYSATLAATGGVSPYSWSVVSGQLPPGLSLQATTGQISGTPSTTGQFGFTVQVVDSSAPAQAATRSLSITVSTQAALDQYGGAVSSPCAGGAKTDFYVEKDLNGRWWFCTPDGHRMFWQGVYIVDRNNFDSSRLVAKYGTSANVAANWKQDMVLRMKYWGFNALGEGFDQEMPPIGMLGGPANPQKLPFNHIFRFLTGGGALINRFNIAAYPIKLLNMGSGDCNNTLHPVPAPDRICYHSRGPVALIGPVPDFFDPKFNDYVRGKAQTATTAAGSYPADFPGTWNSGTPVGHSWVTGFVPDDSDDMMGLAGPGCGNGTNGNGWPGVDGDCHGHVGMLIATSNPYYTMNTGGCGYVSCNNSEPAGSNNPYADNVNHTKAAWIAFLKTRYNNSIAALNTAWSTGGYYTTFDIQAGYPSKLTNSTGVMDDDGGTTAAIHPWFGTLDFLNLTGMNPALKTDLDDFLQQYLEQYYSIVTTWLHTYYPGIPVWTTAPMCGHASGPRDPVVKAAMKYVDVFECEADPHRPQILQHIYQLGCQVHAGCRPIVSTMYITANADSRAQAGGHWDNFRDWPTQTARAGNFGDPFVNWGGVFGQAFLSTDPVSGDHMVAGIQTWDPTDEGTSRNWGFITTYDNPYDGVSPVTGSVPCPPPASVQTNPVPMCGSEGAATGQPWSDFITPITSYNKKWLTYLP